MISRIIFIVGPTATGKSEIAVKLAKKINGEIISCDSMAIYTGMDIVSSKPAKHLQKEIPHHLIDIVIPGKEYNVAHFVKEVNNKIRDILKRKKVPIIVGGSGLYVDSLLFGIFKEGVKDVVLRRRLEDEARERGNEYLYNKLKEIDPKAAEKIHPNNLRRVIRALEVCLSSGKKFSEVRQECSGLMDKYEVRIFGLNLERNKLYQRIDERVDKMFEQGLVQEIKSLLEKKLGKTVRQALGIKEVEGFLKREYDLERAKYLLKRNTRHFAKRQLTWFRRNKEITWLDASQGNRKLLAEVHMVTQVVLRQ